MVSTDVSITKKENIEWAKKVVAQIVKKEAKVAVRSKDKFPYTAVDGVFDDQTSKNPCWWTNGFFGGILWQLYGLLEKDPILAEDLDVANEYKNIFKEVAMHQEEKLDCNFMDYYGMDHDCGFKWLLTAHASELLTGSSKSHNRVMLAANSLAGRFNPNGNFIRAWNDKTGEKAGVVIIDCMMNLPLLYIASEEDKDPRFAAVAKCQADTTMDWMIREDGSAYHIGVFDPEDGGLIDEPGGQGFGPGSAWSRGQGWGLYGFTLSYMHTGCEEYLEFATEMAEYFCSHIPSDCRIPVDFKQPKDVDYTDSCAAAIAASGLLLLSRELRKFDDKKAVSSISQAEYKSDKYEEIAFKLIKYLIENDSDLDEEHDNILKSCTAAYHDKEHEFPIIYGDYYLIEALLRYIGEETFLW